MRLTQVYRILPLADDFIEVCDECGFNGALVDMTEAASRLRSLGARWTAVYSHPEELLRARPAPDTWCAVEYAQHVAFAIAGIEWAGGEFVDGRSPDWAKTPTTIAGEFEHDVHDCERYDLATTLEILAAAANSMAVFATNLTPAEQGRTADYNGGLVMNTAAVVRHALHDAEHHLLDIGRGIARIQLSDINP